MGTYGPLLPFVATSDTSYAAAKVVVRTAPAQRERVYGALIAHGPATAEQLGDMLYGEGCGGDSIRPRLIELRRQERVVDTGRRRLTRFRRRAVVWMAKEDA